MSNLFQNVQTYQRSGLGLLLNLYGVIANLNSKFKDFNKLTANLGDTVTFDLPPRFRSVASLDVAGSFLPAQQRVFPLTVANPIAVPWAITAQDLIFNVEDYLNVFGRSAIQEIGATVESTVAKDIIMGPYRFYGTPSSPVNSYGQVAQALAQFRNFGAAKDVKFLIPDIDVPNIITTGLNQFVLKRNEEIAESWMIGEFDNCTFIRSNLLPTHIAGDVGNGGQTLTLISIDATGTILTFSGATASDANAIVAGDRFQFSDNVAGQQNVRFLTFIGYNPSNNPVQFVATANAAADGSGHVIVTSNVPLISTAGSPNQNLSTALVAGMQATVLPNHKLGMIWGGNAWYLGMPSLPDTSPYASWSETDPETGIALRSYYGVQPFANSYAYVVDAIWGSALVPEYAMALIFPM